MDACKPFWVFNGGFLRENILKQQNRRALIQIKSFEISIRFLQVLFPLGFSSQVQQTIQRIPQKITENQGIFQDEKSSGS